MFLKKNTTQHNAILNLGDPLKVLQVTRQDTRSEQGLGFSVYEFLWDPPQTSLSKIDRATLHFLILYLFGGGVNIKNSPLWHW